MSPSIVVRCAAVVLGLGCAIVSVVAPAQAAPTKGACLVVTNASSHFITFSITRPAGYDQPQTYRPGETHVLLDMANHPITVPDNKFTVSVLENLPGTWAYDIHRNRQYGCDGSFILTVHDR
jgi:hypothetical protein